MRNKIDYGIDLGTTNSSIARIELGKPTIKKTNNHKDTLPSHITINRKADIIVGDTSVNALRIAYTQALRDRKNGDVNTFYEFKRTMGTNHLYNSSILRREMSSEQLSAEILKTLRSLITDDDVRSAVITVPAKFLNPQNEATIRAAQLAGLEDVHLLQEPVAAATAYGLNKKVNNEYWVVFDFGGGTFDVALLKSDSGLLSIRDTDGDNWLGGKNLDDAIVDQIILKYLTANYKISSIILDDEIKQLLRNACKRFAEEAKINLSFQPQHSILTGLDDLPLEDENGNELEIDLTLTQADLEPVVAPIFQRAIDITLDLLKRNNLSGDDIASLILVGGPTYSPTLRRMLKEQVTNNIDTSVDPMTVVAQGAALYASTIAVSDDVKDTVRDRSKVQLDLKYDATSVHLDEMVTISVLADKSEGVLPDKLLVEVERMDGGWTSSRAEIMGKGTLVDVHLVEGQSNAFRINLFDNYGNRIDCQPNEINILQGIGGLDSIQVLPYHFGIGKFSEIEDKEVFTPVRGLEKNKSLPATGVINGLKTQREVRPGLASDVIKIPVYQGDFNSDGTNPNLNNLVQEVLISGETLPKLLPAGSTVDITMKIDRSQTMIFSAFFPVLDHMEELTIEIKNSDVVSAEQLQSDIDKTLGVSRELHANDIENELNQLNLQLENERGSADGRLRLRDGLRKQLLRIDKLEAEGWWPRMEAEAEATFDDLHELMSIVRSNGLEEKLNVDAVNAAISTFETRYKNALKANDKLEARSACNDASQLDFTIRNIVTGNAMDVEMLRHINENFNSFHWSDRGRAQMLIQQGLQQAANGNTSTIQNVLFEIIQLLPVNEQGRLLK